MVVSKNVDAWKDKITTMSYQELGNVEYQSLGIGSKWKNMFELLDRDTLRCVLCETNKIGSWVSIKQHIEGKRHLGKFRVAVRDVRHRTIKLNSGGAQNQKPKVSTQSPTSAKTAITQGKPPTASSTGQAGKPPTASSTGQAGKPPTTSSTGQAAKPPTTSNTGQAGKSPTASSTGQAGKPPTTSSTGQVGKPAAPGNAPLTPKSGTNTAQSTPPNTPKRQELPAPQKQSFPPKETASQNTANVIDSQKGTEAGASPGGKKVLNPYSLQVKSNEEKKPPAYKTLQEFRNDLARLELSEILLVEYRYVNTDYVFLFQQSDNSYTCKMCRQSGILNLQAIRTHMGNKQHQTNISLVKTLHHPVLYPTKDNGESVQPPATTEPSKMPAPSTRAEPSRMPPPSTPAPSRMPPPSMPAPSKIPPLLKSSPSAIKPSTPVQSKPAPSVEPSSVKLPQKPTSAVSAKVDNSKQNDPNENEENMKVDEADDRYNGKNLIPLMKTLEVSELLKIEYRYSRSDWKRMLSQVHEYAYKCLLCSTFLIKNVNDLKNHIGSIRHQSAIKSCDQLHHPDLAPVKRLNDGTRKMTDEQFREHVLKLTVSELGEIEYLMKGSWYKFASCTPSQNRYSCYLCDLINATGSINNMRIHLTTKRHLERMESVQMLFHPLYTASKQELQEQVSAMSEETETCEIAQQNIVCTIELDDSPDREIPKLNEKSKTVLNPVALASSNEKDSSKSKQGTAIKTIMNVGRNPQKPTTGFASQNNPSGGGGNQFYQNENQSWQSGSKGSDLNRFDEISQMRSQSNQFNQTMGSGNQLDPMRSQANNFNKSMSMGYPSQGNNFGQPHLHRNQFDQSMLGSSQGNYYGQSQSMGSQIAPLMGLQSNNSRNMGINPTGGINQYTPAQNNSVQRFQPANSNLRKQYGPTAQQGDRIIIPRVQQKDDNPNNNSVSFTNKDIINDAIQPVEGLIGVEYVVKILRNANDSIPRYECCLCEVEVDGISMQWHLKGLHHRSKYLDRHFPTVMKQFQQYANKPETSYIMSQITDKLAIAIEEYHGRDLPFECLIDEFRLNHDGIKSKVFSFRHPSELTGPSFTNIVDKNSLDEFIARKSFRMPEPDKKRKPTFDVHDTVQAKRLREMSPPSNAGRDNMNRNQSQSMQDNTERNRRFERAPLGRRHQSRSRSRERYHSPSDGGRRYQQHNNRDDWDSYMRMFDHSLVDLKKDYEDYKKDPECHPDYDSEWKKFWTRRTEELRKEGRNPSSYNFQPEWVKFFSRRVHEIFEEKVEELRLIIRKRLNLPLHNNNQLRDEVYHVGVDRISRIPYDIDMDQERHPQFNQAQQRQLQYNQSQQQQHNNNKGRFDDTQRQGQINSAQQQTNQQRRPAEDYDPEDLYRRQVDGQVNAPKVDNKPSENVAAEERANDDGDDDDIIEIVDIKTEAVEIEDDKNMSVSVLRLLTALEDHLGILGPRVIDLLSKALTLEKIKPNGVDEALLNHENYVFLETVREKLKGQLLAGVIEGPKERAVKKVISDMNAMLDKYKDSIQSSLPVPAMKEAPVPPKMTPAKKPAAPVTLNKEELATKLASALAAQGKTDVTPEQLEQLVGVYALIERKQRENALAGKPNQSNQKKSLSDTLIDFLKPTGSNATPPPLGQKQLDRNNYAGMNQTSFTTSTPYTNQMYRNRSPPSLMDSYPSQRMNQSQNMNQTQRMDQRSSYGGNYSGTSGSSMYPLSSQPSSSSFSFIKTPFSNLSQFDTSLKLNTQVGGKWGTFASSTSSRSNDPPMISYPDLRRNNANSNSGGGLSNRTNIWDTNNQGSQQARNDNSNNFGIWQQGGGNTRRY